MSSTKAASASIRDLAAYMRDAASQSATEKVLAHGARNFVAEDQHAQVVEMQALASASARSKQPCVHYVLSWQESEQPTREQAIEAAAIFAQTLGCDDHQMIWALHSDTENVHMHILLNRVCPATERVTKINRGFDIEAAHKAIARIEHAQGWQSETNARYQVLENGDLARREKNAENEPRQPSQRKRDMEISTGEKSAERIAIEVGAPIIKSAQSWQQLHKDLAAAGMVYEKQGGGAVIRINDVHVKASSADRAASLSKLEKRLGAYEPAPAYQRVAQREPEPVISYEDSYGAQWRQYITDRHARIAAAKAEKARADAQHAREMQALREQQKEEREKVLAGDWRGRGDALNALRSALSEDQHAQTRALREQHKQMREQQKQKRGPIIGYEDYLRTVGKSDAADQYRYAARDTQQRESVTESVTERESIMKSEQLKQFEQYAEAVNAERYRVTSIKMREDGSKQTFILDKKDGVTRGFTQQEIAQRMHEMLRLHRRGENLYYTPLSDKKHHILIDDMNREKLDKLISDGYKPAVVIESSPGNYQAIITVPKLGTPHDKDVGNRLSDALNREYGDPRLSGAIHPHRAPGFENKKLKHRREDGSYPEVRLLRSEKRECAKTLAMASEIDAEYQQRAAIKEPRSRAKPALELAAAVSGSAIDAYQQHYKDVLKRLRDGDIDLSRVDSMIAVRMRVTGHDQSAIESAIRQCAPAIRQKDESRDWNDYAQRTARYAYSAAGDRQAADLNKYQKQWMALEGREPQRQRQQRQQRVIERDDSPSMGF